LNQVDVFRVSSGFAEKQFVQCGAATEQGLFGDEFSAEHGDQGTGEHQILFNLFVRRPGGS